MSIFDSIITRRPKTSKFNLQHSRKFSFAPGKLYPVMLVETMPSDRLSHDLTAMVRMMPMQAPVMHLVDVYSYTFSIPNRLCMEHGKWEIFITGGKNGDGKDALGNVVQIPTCNFVNAGSTAAGISSGNLGQGTLADYLGISIADPTGGGAISLNMMPFIAFWLVWNENFRDQDLDRDVVGEFPGIFQATGDITPAIYNAMIGFGGRPVFDFWNLPNVCWEKDYFTSARPWAQKGQPVETPLSGTGTVTYKQFTEVKKSDNSPMPAAATRVMSTADPGTTFAGDNSTGSNQGATRIENIDTINLTSGGFSINDLRTAARLQEWLEKMARGGSRYVEQLKSQFGVTSSDARLQRPEYLAGGKIPVSISEVLQTSENGATPLATMAGHGISAGKINGWSSFFEEHCFVLSFLFMRPKTAYQQGIPRLFTHRFDKLDYPWPSFAQLGEQEIAMSEVYSRMSFADNNEVFGYQQRYAEMKYIPSTVHGEFKGSLDFWHWGREFTTRPTLSSAFVKCDPDPRIFNVIDANSDPCYCVLVNHLSGVRPLPYHGEPTL